QIVEATRVNWRKNQPQGIGKPFGRLHATVSRSGPAQIADANQLTPSATSRQAIPTTRTDAGRRRRGKPPETGVGCAIPTLASRAEPVGPLEVSPGRRLTQVGEQARRRHRDLAGARVDQ